MNRKSWAQLFKDSESTLFDTPPAGAWRRIDRKLRPHQQATFGSTWKWTAIAASFVACCSLLALLSVVLRNQQSDKVLVLGKLPESRESKQVVQVARTMQHYQNKTITEGTQLGKIIPRRVNVAPTRSAWFTIEQFAWLAGNWQADGSNEAWKTKNKDVLQCFSDRGELLHQLAQSEHDLTWTLFWTPSRVSTYKLVYIDDSQAHFETNETGVPAFLRLSFDSDGDHCERSLIDARPEGLAKHLVSKHYSFQPQAFSLQLVKEGFE